MTDKQENFELNPSYVQVVDRYREEISDLRAIVKRLKAENEKLNKLTGIYSFRQMGKYKQALEDIRDVCNCSIEPINCNKCPFNDDCDELCVNDENLQNIIINEINEVLKYE